MKWNYKVEWNEDFYAILHVQSGDLVMNGNLWDGAPEDFDPIKHHREAIEEYERTGLTIWDKYNLSLGHTITVPPHRYDLACKSAGKDRVKLKA